MWRIEEMTGYKPMTTFWDDFSIADRFGEQGVQRTFDVAFAEWKHDYQYLTELVLVLNHKCWQHYEQNNKLGILYDRLYRIADMYAINHLTGAEMEYYYNTTD